MIYPMQTTWKVKKDHFSQFAGRVLWDWSKVNALLAGIPNDYDFINRVYDAQIRLWQVNNARRFPNS